MVPRPYGNVHYTGAQAVHYTGAQANFVTSFKLAQFLPKETIVRVKDPFLTTEREGHQLSAPHMVPYL